MTSAAELLTDSADDTAKAVTCEQMQAAAAAKVRNVFDMLFLLYKILSLLIKSSINLHNYILS